MAAGEGWPRVVTLRDEKPLRLLRRDLDDGEAEAIILAIEQTADVLLLDESEARRIAGVYSLNKTCTVGPLISGALLVTTTRRTQVDATKVDDLRNRPFGQTL